MIEDILLRILLHSPLATKGSKLTSEEIDTNMIEIFEELRLISNPINVELYDNGTKYIGESEKLVRFDSQLWRFISLTDRTGISPGSDPEVWNREAVNRLAHEDNNIAEVTRDELITLRDNGDVKPGRIYHITDRNIYIFGIEADLVNLEGVLVAKNPDYQNLGGNVLGVWTPDIDSGSPGVQVNDIAIYNGVQWKSLTGVAGTAPDGDPANWELLPTTDSSYISEIDQIQYDLANDVIIDREDKRGNKVSTDNSHINSVSPPLNPIDVFQWGNDDVVGNKVKTNSTLTNVNNLQLVQYNELTDSDIIADMQTNDYKRNIEFGFVRDVSASAVDIEGEFNVSGIVVDTIFTDTITPKTAGAGVTVDGVLMKNGSLKLGSGITVNAILDEDDMASDSDESLATQQSIKAFVLASAGAVAGVNNEKWNFG